MIRTVVASKRTVIRNALRVLAESDPGVVVVGEASDEPEVADISDHFGPDVILVDISSQGFEMFRIFRERCPGIILIADERTALLRTAGSAPFSTVDANAPASELTNTIRSVFDRLRQSASRKLNGTNA
ncbi:MAG TPA: hypothetical protein VHB50_01285 [Bryobacteraceae bacterium]|nr:hypothetical protein [Bryobacteraceae bacterium]